MSVWQRFPDIADFLPNPCACLKVREAEGTTTLQLDVDIVRGHQKNAASERETLKSFRWAAERCRVTAPS
jgi:hypothetical protein